MVVIAVLLVMWTAVLAPTILRKIRTSTSERSISSFHHSLDLLESSWPKAISPAFRLVGDQASTSVPQMVAVAPAPALQPRPQLVLLRPPGQGGVDPMPDRYDFRDEYGAYGQRDYAEHLGYDEQGYMPEFERHYASEVPARRPAALRRRNILFGLAGGVLMTGLIGFVVPIAWMVTLISFVLLVAYVGLMAYAATRGTISIGGASTSHRRAEERHVARAVIPGHRAAPVQATWDDEYDEVLDYEDADFRDAPGINRFDDDSWWDEPRRAVAR